MANEIPLWAEFLKAIPSVVTAATAIYGVTIAKAGLDKWKVETIGKRKAELAEEALVAFYEARDVFEIVRSRGLFGGEGDTRKPAEGESEAQCDKRNLYFIPIERLNRGKEVFAKLQSLRYAFAAQFGEAARAPFAAIWEVHRAISSAASVLIEITYDDEEEAQRRASDDGKANLLNTIGWGRASRPDDIDRKIAKAVEDIEAVCRPVLSGRPAV